MNTPESDMEQMQFAREWARNRARKRMDKLEEKLRKEARVYFGYEVAITYVGPGVKVSVVENRFC